MSDSEQPANGRQPSPSAQIHLLCGRFEAACQAGEIPRIEDWLTEVAEPLRPRLLQELLAVEIRCRRAKGDLPDPQEYRNRFPGAVTAVEAAFSPEPDYQPTIDHLQPPPHLQPQVLRIRCPHCHHPIELIDDRRLAELSCPSCGVSFGIVGREPVDAQAAETTQRGRGRFGHFALIEQLGAGAFGVVWKAHDTQLDRVVALKIPRRGELNEADAERFIREARAAAQLRHPNIISVHEVGREGDTLYIVSDYVESLSLQEWLSGQKMTYREAVELCATIADALGYAHEHGVIHRDLKPSNILLDRDGRPYVTDFGLAKREAGEITMTLEGEIMGTPAYMSPEQARGEGHWADRRTDVYSLGAILFELLTGERPFRGNLRMLIPQVIEAPPPRLRRLDNRIPRDLETICLKCLEKNPAKRYATAQELAAELQRYLTGRPIQARPISQMARGWRWCRRNPALATLSLIVLLSIVVGLTVSSTLAVRNARQARENLRLAESNRASFQSEQAQRKRAQQAETEANTHAAAEKALRQNVEQELKRSNALQLAATANAMRAESPLESLASAMRSVEATAPPLPEAEKALRDSLDSIGGLPLPGMKGALSSDGRWAAALTDEGSRVRLFSLQVRPPREVALGKRPSAHPVRQLRFAASGKWLIAIDAVDTWNLWPLLESSDGPSRSVEIAAGPQGVSTSPDGHWLLVHGMVAAQLFDLRSTRLAPRRLAGLAGEGHLRHGFSPDGTLLAVMPPLGRPAASGPSGQPEPAPNVPILLYDLKAAEPGSTFRRLEAGPADANRLAWLTLSPQKAWLAAGLGSLLDAIQFWSLSDANAVASAFTLEMPKSEAPRLPFPTSGARFLFSPDGHWCTTCSDSAPWGMGNVGPTPTTEGVYLWDLTAKEPAATRRALAQGRGLLCFTPDSRYLLFGTMGRTQVFALGERDPEAAGASHAHEQHLPKCFALSPDGKWLVQHDSYSPDALLFRLATAASLRERPLRLPLDGMTRLDWKCMFGHGSQFLVSYGQSQAIRLWNLSDDQRLTSTVLRGHDQDVGSVALSSNDRFLLSEDGEGRCRLWDLALRPPGSNARLLAGHASPINILRFLNHDRWILSVSQMGPMSGVGLRTQSYLWERGPEAWTYRTVAMRPPDAAAPAPAQNGPMTYFAESDGRWFVTTEALPDRRTETALIDLDSQSRPLERTVLWKSAEGGLGAQVEMACGRVVLTTPDPEKSLLVFDVATQGAKAQPTTLKAPAGYQYGKVGIGQSGRWLIAEPQPVPAAQPAAGQNPKPQPRLPVRMWDLRATSPATTAHELPGTLFELSHDRRWLAVEADQPTVTLLDLSNDVPWAAAMTIKPEGKRVALERSWSWDLFTKLGWGPLAISGAEPSPKTPALLDLRRAAQGRLTYRSLPFRPAMVSPDGRWAISEPRNTTSGSAPCGIWAYDLRAEPPQEAFCVDEQATYAWFSNDSRWMILASQVLPAMPSGRIEEMPRARIVLRLRSVADSLRGQAGILLSDGTHMCAGHFSPNSERLAVLDTLGNLQLRWLTSVEAARRSVQLATKVTACVWSQRGDVLVAGFEDGCLRFWDTDVRHLLPFARAMAGGPSAPKEAAQKAGTDSEAWPMRETPPAGYQIPLGSP